jgi:hypothetical protein
VPFDERLKPWPDAHVLEHPADHLLERSADRRHLGGDHLVEREIALELPLERVEHLEIAEALDHHVERVAFGDRPVPVEVELHVGRL